MQVSLPDTYVSRPDKYRSETNVEQINYVLWPAVRCANNTAASRGTQSVKLCQMQLKESRGGDTASKVYAAAYRKQRRFKPQDLFLTLSVALPGLSALFEPICNIHC